MYEAQRKNSPKLHFTNEWDINDFFFMAPDIKSSAAHLPYVMCISAKATSSTETYVRQFLLDLKPGEYWKYSQQLKDI